MISKTKCTIFTKWFFEVLNKNRLTFCSNLINIDSLTNKKSYMKTKKEKPKKEILFSTVNPLELWGKLKLEQEAESVDIINQPSFENEEAETAYQAFMEDFSEVQSQETEKSTIISPSKGSLFIWGLLKEESKRSKRLSSVNHLFKDDVFRCICRKSRRITPKVDFDEMDFDEISKYLEEKKLIRTAKQAVRITQEFAKLFHECYGAWLVF